MKLFHHGLWRDSDSTDEQRYLVFDEDLSELWKLSLGVVVL